MIKVLLCVVVLTAFLRLQAQQPDTAMVILQQDSCTSFWQSKTFSIGVAPAILFAGSAATWSSREEIRKLRNRYIPSFRHHYDDYLQYAPAVAVFGLNAAGVKGKNKIGRATVSYAFSALIMGAIVNSVKYTAKVERPDGSSNNSFPSGHTSNSFMNATFLHKEYGQYRSSLYSVAGYSVATGIAISRQLNNRHWISDVLAGAGIGILSTELGYIFADKIFKNRSTNPVIHKDPVPVDNKPSFIELRVGYAKASSKDLTAKVSEVRARTGFNMGFQGAWFFHKNIGIGGEFAFTSFPMNDDNLVVDPDVTSISKGHYTQPMGLRYLQAGPYFSLPLPKNWFLTAKVTAGSSLGADGNVMLQLTDDWKDLLDMADFPYLRYRPHLTFSWSAGAGVQKRIARNLAIHAFVESFNSDHDFEIDVVDDVTADKKFVFKYLGTEKVRFDHWTYGFGVTAYLW